MAELADALAGGASARYGRGGSSPPSDTKISGILNKTSSLSLFKNPSSFSLNEMIFRILEGFYAK